MQRCTLAAVLIATLLSTAPGCALSRRPRDVSGRSSPEGVSIDFDHLGQAANPLEARLANTQRSGVADRAGSDYWFRIRNESGEAVEIRAFGMYFKVPFEWYVLPDGKKRPVVEEGVDVAVVFERRRPNGHILQYEGPIDFFGSALLPPGRAVVFSVPHAALGKGWAVCVPYTAYGQGGERRARVCSDRPSM